VGIILVVAMLVTPAAVGQLVATSFARLVGVAVAVGIVGPVIGLYLSYWFDAAAGATIVLVETAIFIVALLARRGPIGTRIEERSATT
jgi:ABC-type Mn2+/Zn2+ transport system permease subunit